MKMFWTYNKWSKIKTVNISSSQENIKHYTVLKYQLDLPGLSFLKKNLAIKFKVPIKFTPGLYLM